MMREKYSRVIKFEISSQNIFTMNTRVDIFCVLIACLLSMPQGRTSPRTSTRRYKPVIQVTEEININDITFTTSAPELERSPFHRANHHYSGPKAEALPSPVFPLVVPAVKYKPYKVFKVQDGFRPVLYKQKPQEKTKIKPFEKFAGPDGPKYSKVIPFSNLPTRPPSFPAQDIKNFVPSPTFSPTILSPINNDTPNFPEHSDIKVFTQKPQEWGKQTKKPAQVKKPKKIPENHRSEEEEHFNTPTHSPALKESPQESESFLSEISTLHKGGSAHEDLNDIADTLDLKTGERVEFQMYGMDGPQSYKFGFDTGKGHNRHFRFEERDNTGKVKGHYGYLDEEGKMRIMKYEADPITGFHAGPVELSQNDN